MSQIKQLFAEFRAKYEAEHGLPDPAQLLEASQHLQQKQESNCNYFRTSIVTDLQTKNSIVSISQNSAKNSPERKPKRQSGPTDSSCQNLKQEYTSVFEQEEDEEGPEQ